MSEKELVVVPFGKDGVAGDSMYHPGYSFPYENGMTADDIINKFNQYLMEEWGEQDHYSSAEAFATDNDLNCVGGWVIDKEKLDIITNVVITCGSDSAADAVNRTQKEQVKCAAKMTLE